MGDEADDDEEKPIKYEFSEESKLDEDHLFYLQFTNNFISNVTRPRDFDHCTRWLEKLAGEPMYGVTAKRNRNMYLAMLLVAMQDNKVVGPFSSFPPNGNLPPANIAFGLTTPEESVGETNMLFDENDRELNMHDYKYASEDGRTYIATCALAESMGVMAYVGLTTGGGEGLWVNKEGEKVSLTELCPERIPTTTTLTPLSKIVENFEAYDFKEPPPDPDDPFMYLIQLPETHSEQKLIEVGSYRFDKTNLGFLQELYPKEVIDLLECLLIKSKKNIEAGLRHKHNKVISQLYEAYQKEVENALKEYKEARQEWQLVFNVVEDVKKTKAAADSTQTEAARSNDYNLNLLHSTLMDAKKRKKICHDAEDMLNKQKDEVHLAIHDRALFHKHELAKLNGHVDMLGNEIRRLRAETRRKQQVIDGLLHDLQED